MWRAMSSCASFCQGINRYSFRIIFIRSSQSFHAWPGELGQRIFENVSGHGGESRPGISFWNFTHFTIRPLLFPTGPCCCGAGPH